ncbi:LysR family transcriptional regulator [Alcaligenaceae bacterium CGII-47]|nr:LysR family transcriptional regulator [Alcaligenaceae bacterium CGII-47]
MNLRQLHYFVQMVESDSVAKASHQLFITQTAWSQKLGKLKNEGSKPLLLCPLNVAPELCVLPILEEESSVILPKSCKLIARRRKKINLAEVACLPLIHPTSEHGLRQRIKTELEMRNLSVHIIAGIHSRSLPMRCVCSGIRTMTKAMSAVLLDGERGTAWRILTISDARISCQNYIYTVSHKILCAAIAMIAVKIRKTVHWLIETDAWPKVKLSE